MKTLLVPLLISCASSYIFTSNLGENINNNGLFIDNLSHNKIVKGMHKNHSYQHKKMQGYDKRPNNFLNMNSKRFPDFHHVRAPAALGSTDSVQMKDNPGISHPFLSWNIRHRINTHKKGMMEVVEAPMLDRQAPKLWIEKKLKGIEKNIFRPPTQFFPIVGFNLDSLSEFHVRPVSQNWEFDTSNHVKEKEQVEGKIMLSKLFQNTDDRKKKQKNYSDSKEIFTNINKLKYSNYVDQKPRKEMLHYKPVTLPRKKVERMQEGKKKEPVMLHQKKVERMQTLKEKEPNKLPKKKVERMHIGKIKETQVYKERKKPPKSLRKNTFHSSPIENTFILPNFLSIPYDVPKIQAKNNYTPPELIYNEIYKNNIQHDAEKHNSIPKTTLPPFLPTPRISKLQKKHKIKSTKRKRKKLLKAKLNDSKAKQQGKKKIKEDRRNIEVENKNSRVKHKTKKKESKGNGFQQILYTFLQLILHADEP